MNSVIFMDDFLIQNSQINDELINQIFDTYNLFEDPSKLKISLKKILNYAIHMNYDGDIYKAYNHLIKSHYKGEVNIKSAFYKKIMWKKNQVTIFEVPLGKSRADMFSINGESIIYEIKSEIDNYDRLKNQIENYYLYAEKVYVICNKASYNTILKHVPNHAGIILYNKSNEEIKFYYKRAAKKSKSYDLKLQLKQITLSYLKKTTNVKLGSKEEYIEYIQNHFPISLINSLFKNYLKEKYYSQCNFILSNHKLINDIDFQTFFKLNIPPEKVYKKE